MNSVKPTQIIQDFTEVFTAIPFNKMLGLKLDALEKDHISMSFAMKNELIGNFFHGILHGGVISSVLDMAGGVAAMFAAIQKHHEKDIDELKAILSKSSTTNLNINYLRPGKGEQFFAKAWVLRSGNKLCFTQMELRNEANRLIASSTGTYMVG